MAKGTTIKGKLQRMMLIACGAILLLTCSTYFIYELDSFRESSVKHLSVLGKMLSSNTTAALAFQDKESATEILSSLKAEPNVIRACIYDTGGKIFASFPVAAPVDSFPKKVGRAGYFFTFSHIQAFQPIELDRKTIGMLFILTDTKFISGKLMRYGLIALLSMLLTLLLAYLLSKRLQSRIASPITDLADTARYVSEKHDYSARAVKQTTDEIGMLTDTFNQMLYEIQRQNEEIRRFNVELEAKVEDRTRELALSNAELEAFSYSVSHDLMSPVRQIKLFIELFQKKNPERPDGEYQRLLDTLYGKANKMQVLIEDLLSFSGIEKKELVRVVIDVEGMVKSIWDELVRMEKDRNIEFVMNELPDCYGDRGTMQQVWQNVLGNAIKYTRKRKKALIEVGAELLEREIVYCVKDNGSGFNMDGYENLFLPFKRLHAQQEFEGTGVGLAIVQRILSKHGGRIWAEGKPDEGSVFFFSLPVKA
jgi:signal transduction histidine kinase